MSLRAKRLKYSSVGEKAMSPEANSAPSWPRRWRKKKGRMMKATPNRAGKIRTV